MKISIKIIILPVLLTFSLVSCSGKNISKNAEQVNAMTDKPNFVQYDDDWGKKVLYQPTKKVDDIKSAKIQNLIKRMQEKMRAAGIGLAANQVGRPLQLFMIEHQVDAAASDNASEKDMKLDSVPYQVFINPRITAASMERVYFWHGCLSADGKPMGKIATYTWIDYEAYDAAGEPIKGRLDGLAAIIFQHEFRHLLGSIYLDHAKELLDIETLQAKFKTGEIKRCDVATQDDPFLLADYVIGETIEEYALRL